MQKEITYGGKEYTIKYESIQERAINGKLINSLTITKVNDVTVKPMVLTWNNDTECMIAKTKQLIECYLDSTKDTEF